MARFRLSLLGGFELRDEADTEIVVRSRKLQGLLAYLALASGHRDTRESLANLLWGDRFDAQARQSLRQALASLRALLGERAAALIDADDDSIALRPEAIQVDVSEFERLVDAGSVEDAAGIYAGDFLAALDVRSEPFEAWVRDQRSRLRDLACQALERLLEDRLTAGETDSAIETGRRLVALNPLRERSQRLLIRAHVQAGSRTEALQQFQIFADRLRQELDVEPEAETLQLIDEIRTAPVSLVESSATSRPRRASAGPRPHGRSPWMLVAVGIVAAGLIGSGLWMGLAWAPSGKFHQDASAALAIPKRDRPSIAVLPFDNMSGDATQEYFSDGITEDITTELSKFGLFFVVSRNSTFTYKGVAVDVKDVARELGVQYVLEGSVRKAGRRIRISAQLIDAEADKHVWAEKYDRELEDVFAIQDEITRDIVTSVAPEYLSAEMRRAQRAKLRDINAWDAFMRGYWHLLRFTKEDNALAQRLLRKAIALEPHQSNYYGALSVTYTMDALYGWGGDRAGAFRLALEHAERALALNDRDTQAIRSAGLVHFFSKNHEAALDYYRRAVAANPDEAENRALLGAALGVAGDYDGAVAEFQAAFSLSPRDVHIATWYNYLGIAAFVAGRDEAALDWAKKTVQANPKFPGGHRTLAASYGLQGRLDEAKKAGKKLLQLIPHITLAQMRESLPYFKKQDDLERYLRGLKTSGIPE